MHIGTFGYLANMKLSKNLKVDGELIKNISDSFAPRGGTFKIASFYETLRMKGLNCEVSLGHYYPSCLTLHPRQGSLFYSYDQISLGRE